MASSVNDWKNVPTLHRSQLSSWGIFLRISGATKVGLPHLLVRDCGVWTLLAKPKPATLICESPSSDYLFVNI